jgi:hypothetical protein
MAEITWLSTLIWTTQAAWSLHAQEGNLISVITIVVLSEISNSTRIIWAAASTNSNREFQSNTVTRPVWAYTYSKSWQTAAWLNGRYIWSQSQLNKSYNAMVAFYAVSHRVGLERLTF